MRLITPSRSDCTRVVCGTLLLTSILWVGASVAIHAADTAPADAHAVPAIDGGIGPCSAEFTIKDDGGAPVYDSKNKVHIAYGVFHKLDLEIGTNVDGKARFTGLPNRVKQPPLYFRVSQGDREGSATYDPASDGCRAVRTVTIAKPAAGSSQP